MLRRLIGFRFWWLAGLASLGFAPVKSSAQTKFRIESESVAPADNGTVVFTGVSVLLDRFQVSADKALFAEKEGGKLTLEGNVTVVAEEFLLLSDKVRWDADSQELASAGGESMIFLPEALTYLRTESFRIGKEGVELKSVRVVQGPPEDPPIEFYLASLRSSSARLAWFSHGVFFFHGLPLLYLPIAPVNLGGERASGLLPPSLDLTDSKVPARTRGWRLRVPYFFDLNRDHGLTLAGDWFSQRGLALDVEYDYAFRPGMRGVSSLWFLQESVTRRDPSTETGMKDDDPGFLLRYRFSHRHRQVFHESVDAKLEGFLNYENQSDSEVRRDYLSGAEAVEKDGFLSSQGVGRWKRTYLSVLAEEGAGFVGNSRYAVATDSPTNLRRQPALFYGGNLAEGAAQIDWRGRLTEFRRNEGWRGTRAINQAAISYPFRWGGLGFLPSLELTDRRYAVDYSSGDGNGAVSANADFSYSYAIPRLEIRKEFHRFFDVADDPVRRRAALIPALLFERVPDFSQREALNRVPGSSAFTRTAGDYADFETMFDDRDLVYARELAELRLDLKVEEKEPEVPVAREIFGLRLRQIYDFERAATSEASSDGRKGPAIEEELQRTKPGNGFLPLIVEAAYTPSSRFGLTSSHHYDTSRSAVIERRYGVNWSSRFGSSVRVSFINNAQTYRQPDGELRFAERRLDFSGRYRPRENLILFSSFSWNELRSDFTDPDFRTNRLSGYSAGFRLSNCCYQWGLKYEVSTTDKVAAGEQQETVQSSLTLTFSLFNGDDFNLDLGDGLLPDQEG